MSVQNSMKGKNQVPQFQRNSTSEKYLLGQESLHAYGQGQKEGHLTTHKDIHSPSNL